MKTILFLLAFALGARAWTLCEAQSADPETPGDFGRHTAEEVAMKRWVALDEKKQEVAHAAAKSLTALRADLAAPWTSLIVSLRYDCSCMGTSYHGFRITREGDVCTVMPWQGRPGVPPAKEKATEKEGTSRARPLGQTAVDKLVAETALYYLAATVSISPLELAGPAPPDDAERAAWFAKYLELGGSPQGTDNSGVEVRITTPDGMKVHTNMFERNTPWDFTQWLAQFGNWEW